MTHNYLPETGGVQAACPVGIGGFNVLERCGMWRWTREKFPQVNLCRVHHALEFNQLLGLVLDSKSYSLWNAEIALTMPVLLLTEDHDYLAAQRNVTLLVTVNETDPLENGIAAWLSQIIERKHKTMQSRASANYFSKRETQVMDLLHLGASNETIAAAMGIALSTVKTYLNRIYNKIGASNRAHAVAIYKIHRTEK